MDKKRLATFVSQELQITKVAANAAVDAVIHGIHLGLLEDGVVRLHDLGTLSKRTIYRQEYMHPATGWKITVPTRHKVYFKAGKYLKERLDS